MVRLKGVAGLALWALVGLCASPALAAPPGGWAGLSPGFVLAGSTQANPPSLVGTSTGLGLDGEKSATLALPQNLELNISFLYRRDATVLDPKGQSDPVYNSALNYRLLPNLWVGLSGYLYHSPGDEGFQFPRRIAPRVMGLGPGLRYNLGRWNFVFKSQVESGGPQGEDLQHWFRVWYAF